ncbi:MAG: hypothetical protein LBV57_01045 [Candidatus Symbiothrix sp.]|jgi:hypothetical protein|nr:hypothetical protein [Candidatus Symbiothrix sp.]
MDSELNKAVIKKVLESIPKHIKPIDYLMDILCISRESAYRRMRNDIAFTLDEVAKLSFKLNFSVDNVIGVQNIKERFFLDLQTEQLVDPKSNFLSTLQDYYQYIEWIHKTPHVEAMASLNRLNLFFLAQSPMLFKFYYYTWIHHTYNVPVNCPFSKIKLLPEVIDLKNQFKAVASSFNNCSYILDRNIFENIVREIQYYRGRNLLSAEEVLELKGELSELVNYFQKLMQNGQNDSGFVYNFYLSMLNVELNASYASFGKEVASQYWISSVNPIIIRNYEISNLHKNWIESMKKSSILITHSNELLQVEFINKQREHIENLSKDLVYY